VNPNATWNVSLESYHPYLQPQDVSKGPTTLGTYGSLPKNGKAVLASPVIYGFIFYFYLKIELFSENRKNKYFKQNFLFLDSRWPVESAQTLTSRRLAKTSWFISRPFFVHN
jgi:hypothetical protein